MNASTVAPGSGRTLRAAILGTGYIADFHARAIVAATGVELAAVCDVNLRAAEGFGAAWGVPAYASLDDMLAAQAIDVLHILVPPDLHFPLGKQALEAGVHLFLEKPMCVSTEETEQLIALANAKGLRLGVNHSMLFTGAYQRLREHVLRGDLGPIDYVICNHFAELAQIRFGPFGIWMLREPGNALLEIGPHPLSAVVDLIGMPDQIEATADREVTLPSGVKAYRRWRIRTEAGRVAADVNLELGPGFSQRTILVRGPLGTATCDLEANTCTVDRGTASNLDFDRYGRSVEQARQLRKQARETLTDFALSRLKLRKRGGPYQISFLDAVAAFYAELRGVSQADQRLSAQLGRDVIATCEKVIEAARLDTSRRPRPAGSAGSVKPTILVIGGTGFIGRRLIMQLIDRGYAVRAAGRSGSPALEALGSDRLEIVRADLRSAEDLERVLDGIDTVFHLATSDGKVWEDYVKREIEPSRMLAEACLRRGIKRLIYTGTIDSYYAGSGTITEDTPLDPGIKRRNYYARAKAAVEEILMEMHRKQGLPVVIVRPGIVIGTGGNPFHWGVGRWASDGVCEVWGDGTNPLPLVLVDDVAAGLVRAMEVEGIEGRSYNLIDLPLLSARDYLDELQRLARMRVDIHYRPIWRFWLDDMAKWPLKKAVGHPDGARVPSYHDWHSRTQKALFDCTRTRQELGWEPASDKARIVDEGIAGSLAAWLAARG